MPPYNIIRILADGSRCWVGSFLTLAEARMQMHLLSEARGGEYQIYDSATGAILAEAPTDISAPLAEEETES
jgi:hypothetical protein